MTFSLTGLALTPAGGSDCILYTKYSVSLTCAGYTAPRGRMGRWGGSDKYFEISHQTTAGRGRHGVCYSDTETDADIPEEGLLGDE